MFQVVLVSYEEGQLVAYPGLPLVEALPSFHSFEMKTKPGDALAPTVDFLTTPGSVMLVHADGAQVEADARQIEEWQKKDGGLYNVARTVRLRSF